MFFRRKNKPKERHNIEVEEIWFLEDTGRYVAHLRVDNNYIVVLADKLDKWFMEQAKKKGIKKTSTGELVREIEKFLAVYGLDTV